MIKIQYTITCDLCGTWTTTTRGYRWGEEAPKPTTPTGWTEVRGRDYCPSHVIKLTVDGSEV